MPTTTPEPDTAREVEMDENSYLTLQDVADKTKLSLRTVRDHEGKGILEAERLGRRVRVTPAAYYRYLATLREKGGAPVEEGRFSDRILKAEITEILHEMIADGTLARVIMKVMGSEIREMVRNEKCKDGAPGKTD